jgi:hypothetical protein
MSDDIVAAHLAAALIQAGSQKLDAKTAATIISIAWRLSAQKDKSSMSLPKGALADIDGPGGNKPQPATARGSGSRALAPLGYPLRQCSPTVALMQKHEDGEIVFRHACKLGQGHRVEAEGLDVSLRPLARPGSR